MSADVREHPILFSGPMVQAILAGRKTQTRRVIKPQPQPQPDGTWEIMTEDAAGKWYRPAGRFGQGPYPLFECPYGQPGDRLWLRETWAAISKTEDTSPLADCNIEYRADTSDPYPGGWSADEAKGNPDAPKWQPSIHMPRWASRITLEITDVRVQRVNYITAADIEAEGIERLEPIHKLGPRFIHLWDSINAKRGYPWADNPWVWALTFRRLQP